MNYETLKVDLDGAVATVTLNRPDKANAMALALWQELRTAMRWADETGAVRVVILRGAGRQAALRQRRRRPEQPARVHAGRRGGTGCGRCRHERRT